MDILNAFNRLPTISYFGVRRDDDFADRLNYKYTVGLLILFSIIVASKQFSNDPIQCWVPAIFTRNYEIYVSNYCWIHNTYHINISEPQMQRAHEKRYVLRYYQFVPFILLLQALFYVLPRLFWRSFSRHSGIDVRNIMEAAHSLKSVKRFHKQKSIMGYLVSLMHQYVGDPRKRLKQQHSKVNRYLYGLFHCFFRSSNVFNSYLFLLYLLTKVIFILNNFIQVYAIRLLLEEKWTVNQTLKGFQNIFTTGILRTNPVSKFFPKISMCDFRIIEPNSDEGHKYTVQCVLTINVYNEQIFTLLYIWMHFVLVITVYDFLSWLIFLILPRLRYSFLIKRIQTQHSVATVRAGMQAFVYDYLQHDGFFIFRLIYANVGDDVTTNILTNLWKNFQRADKSAMTENTTANIGATISLTGADSNGVHGRHEGPEGSIFDYSKTSTNL
ncbi:unnamed protein product [Rotaria socialis]|uniref:Innexin n=1 Tax=Rotaria socialis TaxID=392032 RepID=A0A817TUZ0_9BILA|nr:unnamed protein product [Rotaria socialis]CAF3317236.1 unnamed protein product [Rotaria socialis]CAF3526315.1 unnamed protein product [Rotaria socialis]CAF3628649.1 unnamed protein product [Rotaria socialis]CAF3712788.1 unnamed protein product [Rotaria socialis]